MRKTIAPSNKVIKWESIPYFSGVFRFFRNLWSNQTVKNKIKFVLNIDNKVEFKISYLDEPELTIPIIFIILLIFFALASSSV